MRILNARIDAEVTQNVRLWPSQVRKGHLANVKQSKRGIANHLERFPMSLPIVALDLFPTPRKLGVVGQALIFAR